MKRNHFLRSIMASAAIGALPTFNWAKTSTTPLATNKANGSMYGFQANPLEQVRIGIIGLGNRGGMLMDLFQWMVTHEKALITGLCDLEEDKVKHSTERLAKWQERAPRQFFGGPDEWRKMTERSDIDLLIIATPWALHAPMAVYGMEQGKHVAVEVPIAFTMEECWQLVETAERTRQHCMMLENCCYGDEELWVLNMAEQGVFGDITHAEGAYLHDLRMYMLHENYYQDQWRLKHHENHNGNLYSTHGLGPIAMYMHIGRGDAFDHLVSMSSREKNLTDAARNMGMTDATFKAGDINHTLIKTKKGKTILLQFDTHTGQPYSRINKLSGTKATHNGYPSRLFIEPQELNWHHEWQDEKAYQEYRQRFEHPIIKELNGLQEEFKQGHGGMDFVMLYRLITCLNQGRALDLNLYDGLMWSAITPLSEKSVSSGNTSIPFPDLTGGQWKNEHTPELMRTI